MLLTLTARSLNRLFQARGRDRLRLEEAPRKVLELTGLRGLIVDTELLKGWSVERLDGLRRAADQAGCPCLALRESFPVRTTVPPGPAQEKAINRIELVARAANRLGCSAIALTPASIADPEHIDASSLFLRAVMERLDRLELHVFVEPSEGMLAQPRILVEMVKKVGGFRIGTMPGFGFARATGDCVTALRLTVPYAGIVIASSPLNGVGGRSKGRKKAKEPDPLQQCIGTLLDLGYGQVLAIDYLGDDGVAGIAAVRREIEGLLGLASGR